eukprot:7929440-Alexandrium_andersonii.AAC.1
MRALQGEARGGARAHGPSTTERVYRQHRAKPPGAARAHRERRTKAHARATAHAHTHTRTGTARNWNPGQGPARD